MRRTGDSAGVAAAPDVVAFNVPHVTALDREYVAHCLHTSNGSADGPYSERATMLLRGLVGDAPALLTPSGTHALELAAVLLELQPGDEVIVPSFTFSSTATAFVARGAVPVFVDSRPDTLNLDERLLESAITDRTRAVVVMHYGGVACAMDEIRAICASHNLRIVEDNAHGITGSYRGRPLGSFGDFAAQSFHVTKNVQCGEGGALVVNDPAALERAEIVREKGTDRSKFMRGEIDKYTWRDQGSSMVLAELLAAQLTAQLERVEEIQTLRQQVWSRYNDELSGWADMNDLRLPVVPDGCEHPAHLYFLLLRDLDDRDAFIAHLRERGVRSAFHYIPLDSSPGGRRFGRTMAGGCPVAADSASRLARLPLYPDLGEDEIERIVAAVKSFRAVAGRR